MLKLNFSGIHSNTLPVAHCYIIYYHRTDYRYRYCTVSKIVPEVIT
jgi:hypothetical protein